MLSHALNQPKSWVLAHGEYELEPVDLHTLQSSVDQLLQGVPLPYLLNQWEFYGRTFKVTPDVLIPRPETELLVELTIANAKKRINPSIVDVGTGSGAIAISLAAELPSAKMIALDLSWKALLIAQENARIHHQNQISFVQSDLLSPFHTQFDLICANLPYIPSQTLDSLVVVKSEPRLALDGGQSGLEVIRLLLEQAKTHLSPNGTILFEIEETLGQAALAAAKKIMPDANHDLIRDLSGRDRLIQINHR